MTSVAITIPVSVAVAIAIMILAESLAIRRNPFVRNPSRNTVVRIDIPHTPFHARSLIAIVGLPVLLPAGVITVESCLIFRRKPMFLSKQGRNER
jgi:hypothetical protein